MSRTFEQGKVEVAELVRHFANNREAYHGANYKEAHARQEFIDPLFSALGWDAPVTVLSYFAALPGVVVAAFS